MVSWISKVDVEQNRMWMLWIADSAVAAMPSFDDIDKILNSSGIAADVMPSDGAVTTPPTSGMCLSCYSVVVRLL